MVAFVKWLGAALLLLGGVLLVARYRSTLEVSPYDLAERTIEDNALQADRIGAKVVTLPSGLRALIRPPAQGASWLIYWGGNTSTYFQESVETIAGLALPPDLGVLVVAPPGYDGSAGHPSPEALPVEARRAREWLRAQHGAKRIVTAGFSLGTLSALAAADEHAVGVVLLSPPTLFETQEPGRFVRFREPIQYRPAAKPPAVPGLVLHGELDDGFPIQMGRDVAAWLGARFVALPGVGHVELQTNAAALSEARAFIIKALNEG